jgi:hypothetical protein
MAGRDLCKPGLAREFGQALFVRGIFPGVHQHDGAGADAVGDAAAKACRARRLRPGLDLGAVDVDAAADLDHPFVEHASAA